VSLQPPEKIRRLQEALGAKAKREPSGRFHALYDKVYREDVLLHAWTTSRSKAGAPGVDGQSFADVEAYGVERWLAELGEELHKELYKPQPVRRVMIPKAGGVGERPLGIPTIRDRVVQTAAKLVLEPIFEEDFDEAAYGYRPGRTALEAVVRVHEAVQAGHTEVVDADLSQYFDTIPHADLMKCLARRISDGRMLHLLKMWLKAPVEECDELGKRRMTGGKKATRGTPQGGVISPLLANIYMHRFIKAFRRYEIAERYGAVLVNYADDFVILCRRKAGEVLEIVRRWTTRIGLALSERKTTVRRAQSEPFDFLGYTFEPMRSPKNGWRYLGARPSKKAVRRFKDGIRARLRPGNQAPWDTVVLGLNRVLRGWANYFAYGTLAKVRRSLDWYVYERTRDFLKRRHKVQGLGSGQFPMQRVHGPLGVLTLESLPRIGFAHALA
jgi:RNA-directed DNA polymerase